MLVRERLRVQRQQGLQGHAVSAAYEIRLLCMWRAIGVNLDETFLFLRRIVLLLIIIETFACIVALFLEDIWDDPSVSPASACSQCSPC